MAHYYFFLPHRTQAEGGDIFADNMKHNYLLFALALADVMPWGHILVSRLHLTDV